MFSVDGHTTILLYILCAPPLLFKAIGVLNICVNRIVFGLSRFVDI